ncbi:hypothetical protein D3C85_885630 [compost metagenome]
MENKRASVFDKDMQIMAAGMLVLAGFKPSYTPESLPELEAVIERMFPDGALFSTTHIPFGWYLGEVIVRNIPGAQWQEENSFLNTSITIPGYADRIQPFIYVEKFFSDRSLGLKNLYDSLLSKEAATNEA